MSINSMPTDAMVGLPEFSGDSTKSTNVVGVQFRTPLNLELQFADGLTANLPIEKLDMPSGKFAWEKIQMDLAGNAIVVEGVEQELIPIDGPTLRYLVDPVYAKEIDDQIAACVVRMEDLRKSAEKCKPPQEWYDQPARDLVRPSWK